MAPNGPSPKLPDYISNGNKRSGIKAVFSGISVVLDLVVNVSVAVKPAFRASRYYSKATGRYVSDLVGTREALKPYLISGAVDIVGDAVSK